MKINNSYFNNKKIFITGGTGTFGTAMINHLTNNYKVKKITVYSRDEMKQWYLKEKILGYKNPGYKNIDFILGDVRASKDMTMFFILLQLKLFLHLNSTQKNALKQM